METETQKIWDIFDDVKGTLQSNSNEDENGKQYKKEYCLKCSECDSYELIHEDGMIVCSNCGVQDGIIIDYKQEWRFYGNDDSKYSNDPTRCGMPINPLLPDASLGTIIIGRGYENFKKINNWNSMTYKERSLLKVFKQIQSKSADKNIPGCVVDRAKIMYKTLSEDNIKRGQSRKGLIVACIYYSFKDKNESLSTKEISEMFDLDIKKMSNGCKQFNEIMYHNNLNYSNKIRPTEPAHFIDHYAVVLHLDELNKNRALHVAKMAEKLGVVAENTPSSIAVGSLYLTSQYYNLNITKKKLADNCNISEVTISKAYKKMCKFQKFLLPNDEDLNPLNQKN